MAPNSQPRELWLVGVGTEHSVAPALHTFIAKELNLPWKYVAKEFHDEQQCLQQIKMPVCAGCAVTMPCKKTIMPLLDDLDESARVITACNTISINPAGRLTGYSHDWIGIARALKEASSEIPGRPTDRSGLIIGAEGAARAAVYALWNACGMNQSYVINRVRKEVLDMQADIAASPVQSG